MAPQGAGCVRGCGKTREALLFSVIDKRDTALQQKTLLPLATAFYFRHPAEADYLPYRVPPEPQRKLAYRMHKQLHTHTHTHTHAHMVAWASPFARFSTAWG